MHSEQDSSDMHTGPWVRYSSIQPSSSPLVSGLSSALICSLVGIAILVPLNSCYVFVRRLVTLHVLPQPIIIYVVVCCWGGKKKHAYRAHFKERVAAVKLVEKMQKKNPEMLNFSLTIPSSPFSDYVPFKASALFLTFIFWHYADPILCRFVIFFWWQNQAEFV